MTTTDPPVRRKRKRGFGGWLMIEVAVGGVMATTILGGLLVNVGAAMDETTLVSRKLTASMLAQQGIEQARNLVSGSGSDDLSKLPDAADVDVPPPAGLTGNYTRTRTVTSGTTSVGSVVVTYKDVSVTVTFNYQGATKTVTLSTRIYDA